MLQVSVTGANSIYMYIYSVTGAKSIYIYILFVPVTESCIYAKATCFDLVGHPRALQEHRFKHFIYNSIYVRATCFDLDARSAKY